MVTEINKDNFKTEVEDSNIPVIIDFFADWCMPCQMMKPVFEEISKDFEGKLKFVKVNTDENPELSQKFDIGGIPCLVLAKEGKEFERLTGFMPKEVLKAKIEKII